MSKSLKILGVLLLLPVIAVVLVALLFDAGDYKQEFQAKFSEVTGHELRIEGDMRASLLPRPVLKITKASVLGAPGNRGPALAELDLVQLYPRLVPLLMGRVEWDLARVQGLHLRLVRDEQGRANWNVAEVSPGPAEVAGPQVSALTTTYPPGPFDVLAAEAPPEREGLVIGGIEILDSRVTWDDRRFGWLLELDDLELFASPIARHEPIAFRMSGSLRRGNGGPSARLRAEGNLGAGMLRLRLEQATLALEKYDLGKGLVADLDLRTEGEADLDARRYMAGEAVLEIHVFGSGLSNGRTDASASARLDLDLGAERLQVSDLLIRSGALSVRGSVLGQNLLSAPPLLTGDLAVDEFDLRAWLQQWGLSLPATVDAATFRRFSLSSRWRLEQGLVGLQDLVLGIDQTGITGEVEQVATGSRSFRFDLQADRLDLDRYLPVTGKMQGGFEKALQLPVPTDKPVASKVEPAKQLSFTPLPLPLPPESASPQEAVGDLNVEGRLSIGDLELARLRFGDVDTVVRVKDRYLDVDDRIERFYGGRSEGRLSLDLSTEQPVIALAQRAEEVQIGPLLVDLAREHRLSGRGSMTADLTATGWSVGALRRSLAGKLSIDIPHGVVKGVNLERAVREAEARLRGKSPPAHLPTHTDFNGLHASGEVQGGVLHNRDLVASTEYLRITGSGTVDLGRERFDYRFEPVVVKPPKGRGIKELEGIPVPVHLTGSFARPRWNLDLESALKAAGERRLNEHGDDLLQELEERTGIKGLGQGLKNLFGQ